ncbi:MAG: BACON domain-containing protein [Candidatus Cryptobacteroides sp.]
MNLNIFKSRFALLLAIPAMLAGCDEDPVVVLPEITLDKEVYECDLDGGSVDVTVTSEEDWILEGYAYWAVPSITEGSDGDVVTFTVEKNNSLMPLEAEFIFIAGEAQKTFTIRQSEGIYIEDAITLSENALSIGPDGGTLEVTVTSSKGWLVPTYTNSWCHISSAKGQSGDVVTFTVDPSYQAVDRKATFTFKRGYAEQTLTITQEKRPTSPYDIVLSETAVTVEPEGGTVTLIVESALYDWTMQVSGTLWCHVDNHNGTKDEKNVELVYTIDPNNGASQRISTTTFRAGPTAKTFKITQKAPTPTPEDVVVSGELFDMPAEGGTVQVVLKSVKYDWTLSAYPPAGWSIDNTARKGTKDDKDIVFNITANANTATGSKTLSMTFSAGPTRKVVKIVQPKQN